MALGSCDQTTRYKVLTFFFEGVPAPGSKRAGAGADANLVTITNVDRLNMMNAIGRAAEPDKWGQNSSSTHEFVKDCAQCHTGGLSSGRQELREPLPQLCYACHTDFHQEDRYLHGPLNVGECLFCHDPHQSAYVHLQKAPQPQLCFKCHQQEDIETIPGHGGQMEQVCTECHDPHGSSGSKLLKADWESHNDPNTIE